MPQRRLQLEQAQQGIVVHNHLTRLRHGAIASVLHVQPLRPQHRRPRLQQGRTVRRRRQQPRSRRVALHVAQRNQASTSVH
jgi:hypothetical protein